MVFRIKTSPDAEVFREWSEGLKTITSLPCGGPLGPWWFSVTIFTGFFFFFHSFNLLKNMLDLKSEDPGSSLALGLSKCALYLEHVTLSL